MSLIKCLRSLFASRTSTQPQTRRPLMLEPLEARENPSTGGLLDPTFGSGGVVTNSYSAGIDLARDLLVQPDGKLVIAGNTQGKTGTDFLVSRYNVDGTLDSGFGKGGFTTTDFSRNSDSAQAVALQPGTNGKIVVGGSTSRQVGSPYSYFALTRYNANGSLDTTFGKKGQVVTDLGTSGAAWGMAVQSDGKIILAGSRSGQLTLVRYTSTGALDSTFGSGGTVITNIRLEATLSTMHWATVIVQPNGKIVTSVTVDSSGDGGDFLIARFNADGSADTSFGGGDGIVTTDFGSTIDNASGLALQSDGRIVVSGQSGPLGKVDVALARYNSDGSLDSTFGSGGLVIAPVPQGFSEADDVAVQADGAIVIAGRANGIALAERFNADGSVDTGYGPSGTGRVELASSDTATAVAIQADGSAVFAGSVGVAGNSHDTDVVLFRLLGSAPQVSSSTSSATSVPAGDDVTLAVSAFGGNPGALGAVTQVAIYADSNGDGNLDAASDTLVGYASYNSSTGQWELTLSTTGWTAGRYSLFAVAKDGYDALSDPLALTLDIV